MERIITRHLHGSVCAYEPTTSQAGELDPVAEFRITSDDEVHDHAVTAELHRALYATKHEVVCIDRGGTELWRYEFVPRSKEKYGHWPSCDYSLDESLVWVYRPDAMAGRGNPDMWVVLDAGSGSVVAQAELETAGHGATSLRHPSRSHFMLSVGEGQDGCVVYRGALSDGALLLDRYPWADRCPIDISPDGRRFMSVDHGQSDVQFHEYPGGEVVLTLPIEVFGHGPEDAYVEWSGGYLDPDTAIVTVGGETEDEEDWHQHYLVDLRTGGVQDSLDAHSRNAYDFEPLGDGSWLTSTPEGRPILWRYTKPQ
ncbi:hypothetical protein ACQPZP_06925 [Spirillospora sp. CA-142024]|uniref:hypothetical protein n=1 Tax=Spirillospora sp. CA-142024 TaxID=3240036 RepID=UPI003D89DEB4